VFGNALSRVYLLDDGQSFTELQEYEGNHLVHFTNDHGVGYHLELNAAGDMTKRTYGQARVEEYSYDAHGRLVGVSDANGNPVLEIAYDAGGEVASRTFATGATDVTEAASSAGIRFVQGFDVYGNVTETEVYGPESTGTPEQSITTTYDPYQRLVTTANETVSMTATYDDFARTRSMTVDFGDFSKTYSYELDDNGRRVAFVGPDGSRTEYEYTASGRLVGATDAQGTTSFARSGTYGEEVTLPGGITSVTSRDALSRVTRVLSTTPGGETLMDQQYTWDAHRLTATSTEHGPYDYAYDDTGRVVGASYPTVEQTTIALDPSGNRSADAAFGSATPVYNSANQLVSFGSAASYAYDAEGNMTQRTEGGVTTTYEYNAANQLVRVLDGSGAEVASYAYDPLGRRVKKVVGGEVTWFLYAEEGLIGEFDAQGKPLRTYGWRPGTEWQSAPLWMRVGTQVYYYLVDRVGTPQKLVDADGQVVWSVETEAYGAGHVAPGSIVTNNMRFSSQYYDEETGLHYNLFRYYDPRLGRYLNVEPLLEMSNRTNYYEFADNNPLLRADRMGLATGSATTDGGSVSVGGGVKLGGIGLSGSLSVGREDCCIGGKMIRGGKICVTVKVAASAGGVGGEGFGGKAELALVEVEGAGSCKRCSGCGGGPPSGDCCITVTVTVGKVDLKIGIFKAEFSIFSVSYQMCWSGAGGPGFSGPGASGGFGFGGGKGGGGKG
jgi:RHS repeat-associated protein